MSLPPTPPTGFVQYPDRHILSNYNIFILSMHGADLPAQTKRWIESWSRLITDSKPVLVALLDQPETRRGMVASTLGYLHNVADRKGISFYAHTTFWPSKN